MKLILAAAAVSALLGAAFGAGLGLWLRSSANRLAPFRVLLLVPLVPYAFHAYWTYRYSVGWVDSATDSVPIGAYPGATAFAAAATILALITVLVALWLSSRVPLLSALQPAVLFTVYLGFSLPLLRWRFPFDGPILDHMPNIWLFLLSVGCTTALLAMAWIALPRWPARA